MNKTAVIFCTYPRSIGGEYFENFLKYKNENFENFFVLFDDQGKEINNPRPYKDTPIYAYNLKDFDKHSFNRPIDKSHRWGNHQNPNYFYAHFRMLLFYMKYNQFDYYWFFDDDVYFDKDLKPFLSEYEQTKEDFIAIQAFKKEDYETLPHVSKLNNRMGSRGNWLGFAPGPGDQYKSINRHLGCFFPIVRYSNRAMKHLIYLNDEGYYGYSEGFVPTCLASDGFRVASMLDEHDNYFIKPKTQCKLTHKNDNFTWTWI